MQDYAVIENAVVDYLVTHFPDDLSPARCKAGDVDTVLDGIFNEGAVCGCILEFGGGYHATRAPFSTNMWWWDILGIFLIRKDGQEEQTLRRIIARLAALFEPPHHTLDGLTPSARISRIEQAEPAQINDAFFYWLPFEISVADR